MTWWRRNRIWVALLAPLLAAALLASSFRVMTLYRPLEWTAPVTAEGSSGVLRQGYLGFDGARHEREVTVTVQSVQPHTEWRGTAAVAGATLWVVALELAAAPDQELYGCEVELVDAGGARYDVRSGVRAVDDGFFLTPLLLPCVPEEAPGPTIEPLTGEHVPSPMERPATWPTEALIAMPDGVDPVAVRIGWSRPDYLEIQIP